MNNAQNLSVKHGPQSRVLISATTSLFPLRERQATARLLGKLTTSRFDTRACYFTQRPCPGTGHHSRWSIIVCIIIASCHRFCIICTALASACPPDPSRRSHSAHLGAASSSGSSWPCFLHFFPLLVHHLLTFLGVVALIVCRAAPAWFHAIVHLSHLTAHVHGRDGLRRWFLAVDAGAFASCANGIPATSTSAEPMAIATDLFM
jgi:hypothetical protein